MRADITDDPKKHKGELRTVFNRRSSKKTGLYYSDGNKWIELGLLEDLILNPKNLKIKERSGRGMKISLDKLNLSPLRTLYMANKDIYLGELIDWKNQFSWTKVEPVEHLTIYDNRQMVVEGTFLLEGNLTIKGKLTIL